MDDTVATRLPELSESASALIRIPRELDVRLSPRAKAIVDSEAMQRLKQISQLGLVAQVYPGAVHSRFEHSLGVYRLACNVVRHLLECQAELAELLTATDVKVYLLAALLHDVGHWPFCHAIEDIGLSEVPEHEKVARHLLVSGQVATIIEQQWQVAPDRVADFLDKPATEPGLRLLQGLLSGPVDIDKMDYLQRDSLHAGVPYGLNFDQSRLINSLRVTTEHGVAITEKGKTAAEMMVFARYVMFSEVYWHHAVRSATAMLQRAVYELREQMEVQQWQGMSDADFAMDLGKKCAARSEIRPLVDGLFGRSRRLYKRLAQFSFSTASEVHARLAGRPFSRLVEYSASLCELIGNECGVELSPQDLLIDAPPVKLEVQFRVPVLQNAGTCLLSDISPVVRALATEQFDNYVKQVRVFVNPAKASALKLPPERLEAMLMQVSDA